MNIAVDIGNTRVKCGFLLDEGRSREWEVHSFGIPPRGKRLGELTADYPKITWQIAQTGSFSWQELKAAILKVRPRDKFKLITRKQIPLKLDVEFPQRVGIDRLLAAFAAIERYGDAPMLIVDAGSAITIDVVQDRTFCGGAILPGLVAQSKIYPQISEKLPLVQAVESQVVEGKLPIYPGRNTKDAIRNGIYWGTIGAIRQFYEMFCLQKKDAMLILTGGDAEYLLPEIARIIPSQKVKHHRNLILEGISRCVESE